MKNEVQVALEKQIADLIEENSFLKDQIKNLTAGSITQEREAISFYIELVANKIHGIPSISKIIKEVLIDVSLNIRNGEHFKLTKKSTFNGR